MNEATSGNPRLLGLRHAKVPVNVGDGGAIVDAAFADHVAHVGQGRNDCREHGQLVARLLDVVARAPIADRQPALDLEARQVGAHPVVRVDTLSGAAGGVGAVVG